MGHRAFIVGFLVTAALLSPCAALAAPPAPEWIWIVSEPATARMLLGTEVRSAEGRPVGRIADLELDLQHNRVHRVVIEGPAGELRRPMHGISLDGTHAVLDPAHESVPSSWQNTRPALASRLLGAPFTTHDGLLAGEVVDLVIDAFWGEVPFVVARTGEALRPVALEAFVAGPRALTLAIAAEALRASGALTPEALEAQLRNPELLERQARLAHELAPTR